MSLLNHLDQIFDLDIALTTSSADNSQTDHDESSTAKLSNSISLAQRLKIDQLPIVTEVVVGVCTVCLESFKPISTAESNLVVPCGHVFHRACIYKWLSRHNSCPLCRFDIADAAVQDSCL